jgi:hypothetical protein
LIGSDVVSWDSGLQRQLAVGDAARQIIVRWAPQLVPTLSLTLDNLRVPAQLSPPAVQTDGGRAAPAQPAHLAQTAPEGIAPTAAVLPPELTQLLQSMARDLASVGQRIEQLKASQEQMAHDNAHVAEQLKVIQGTNGPRHCQGFGTKPADQDTSACATADCHPNAEAGVHAPVAANRSAVAGRENAVVIGAPGVDAPALLKQILW